MHLLRSSKRLLLIHQNDWFNLLLLDMSLNGIKPIKEERLGSHGVQFIGSLRCCKKVRGRSDFQKGSRVNFLIRSSSAHFVGMMCEGLAHSLQMSKRLIHMLDGTMH